MSEAKEIPGHLRRLSRFLDSSIRLPGGFRIGWDGIIGLIPGVGDALGLLMSSYIVAGAARMGVSKSVLARMGLNVALESVIGAIPVFGDMFDFVFKANSRNIALIEKFGVSPDKSAQRSSLWLLLLGLFVLFLLAGVIYAVVRLCVALIGLV